MSSCPTCGVDYTDLAARLAAVTAQRDQYQQALDELLPYLDGKHEDIGFTGSKTLARIARRALNHEA